MFGVTQACGRQSANSRATDFYELDLSIKGSPSLAHSLAAALEAEELRGENQYRCEWCQAMVDATRQLRLEALPPYLCISLKRFVFNLRVQRPVR